jgi:hypothetical protein
MFMHEADFIQEEVSAPINNWCSSGHAAPELFRRGGPNSPQEPIRFFRVISKGEYLGTFCEPCLMVASWLNHVRKKDPSFMK